MNFCSECGAVVELKIPPGDNLPRYVCINCRAIHYQNPKIIVGCIPAWEGKVLLCRRAIEPGYGLWTLPAGFMEKMETADEGAARETLEEACAVVAPGPLFAFYNLPRIGQVYLLFRGQMLAADFAAGDESLEVGLFAESEVPWEQIAFKAVRETLVRYFADSRRGEFGFHYATI